MQMFKFNILKAKEENLVVFVDVPFGIWLAVMELKMVTVSDKTTTKYTYF